MARTVNTDGTLDRVTSQKFDESSKLADGIKLVDKAISRSVTTIEGEERRIAQFKIAEVEATEDSAQLINAMLSLAEGKTIGEKLASIASDYNAGRYSVIRSAVNNELGGLTEEQKAFNRVVSAMKQLPQFKGKSDDKIVELLKSNPALMGIFGAQVSEDESEDESEVGADETA